MTHSKYLVIKGDAFCLFKGMDKLKRMKSQKKKIKTVEYVKERKFCLIDVDIFDPNKPSNQAYEYAGKFWADIVTGTLYHPETGECQSSTQIQLILE